MEWSSLVGFASEWMGAVAVAWLIALSPRFKRRPIGFVYAQRDGIIALSIYILILAFAILFAQINPPLLPETLRISPAPVHDLGQALLLAVICVVPFVVSLAIRRQPIRSLGWSQALFNPGLQAGFALAFLTVFLRNRVMDVLGGLSSPALNALPLAIGIGLAEETIFRGYIQMRLSWWLGTWQGVAVTALMFAIWHVPALFRTLPVEQALIAAGLTFIQGLVLGWVMHKSGHVLAPALYRGFSIWVTLLG